MHRSYDAPQPGVQCVAHDHLDSLVSNYPPTAAVSYQWLKNW